MFIYEIRSKSQFACGIFDYIRPLSCKKTRTWFINAKRLSNFSSSCRKWILATRQLCQKVRRRFHESSNTAAKTGLRGRVRRARQKERGRRLRRMIVRPHPLENCGTRLAVPKDTLTIGTLKRMVSVLLSNFFIFLLVFRQAITMFPFYFSCSCFI